MYSYEAGVYSSFDKKNYLTIPKDYIQNGFSLIMKFSRYTESNVQYLFETENIAAYFASNASKLTFSFYGSTSTPNITIPESTDYYIKLRFQQSTYYDSGNEYSSRNCYYSVSSNGETWGSETNIYSHTDSPPQDFGTNRVINIGACPTVDNSGFQGSIDMNGLRVLDENGDVIYYGVHKDNPMCATKARVGFVLPQGDEIAIDDAGRISVENDNLKPKRLLMPVIKPTMSLVTTAGTPTIDKEANTLYVPMTNGLCGAKQVLETPFTIGTGNYFSLRGNITNSYGSAGYENYEGTFLGLYSNDDIVTNNGCCILLDKNSYGNMSYDIYSGGAKTSNYANPYFSSGFFELEIDGLTLKLWQFYDSNFDHNEGYSESLDITALDGMTLSIMGLGCVAQGSNTGNYTKSAEFTYKMNYFGYKVGSTGTYSAMTLSPSYQAITDIDTNYLNIDSNGKLAPVNPVQSTNIHNIVQISQADYDTLVNNGTVNSNTFYIITST